MPSILPAQPNQSLIEGLSVLQAVASRSEPLGVRELGRLLDMDPTRTNRLLKTLAYLGLVRQTTGRKYAPGPGIHVLAVQSLSASGLLPRALPVLDSLRSHKLQVALGVLWRLEVCYLYFAGEGLPVEDALSRSRPFPALRSSIGMALLASRPKESLAEVCIDDSIPAIKIKQIEKKLQEVHRKGYAYLPADDFRAEPSVAVAIPEPDGSPPQAAVAFVGKIKKQKAPELAALLRDGVKQIVAKTEAT